MRHNKPGATDGIKPLGYGSKVWSPPLTLLGLMQGTNGVLQAGGYAYYLSCLFLPEIRQAKIVGFGERQLLSQTASHSRHTRNS